MFDIYEEQSASQAEGRVVRNEAEKEARSLIRQDEDFLFYSKYVIGTNEQKSKHECRCKCSDRKKQSS